MGLHALGREALRVERVEPRPEGPHGPEHRHQHDAGGVPVLLRSVRRPGGSFGRTAVPTHGRVGINRRTEVRGFMPPCRRRLIAEISIPGHQSPLSCQRPFQVAGRFSVKAAIPSFWSSLANRP